jgi:hypothetical protein
MTIACGCNGKGLHRLARRSSHLPGTWHSVPDTDKKADAGEEEKPLRHTMYFARAVLLRQALGNAQRQLGK